MYVDYMTLQDLFLVRGTVYKKKNKNEIPQETGIIINSILLLI